MSQVLADVPRCSVYINDICIHTPADDPRQHLQGIKRVLARLHECGLKINFFIGTYFKKRMAFLGKMLDAEGISHLPEHVEAFQQFPCPKSKKQLNRFLGLLAFTSCFIFDFCPKTSPCQHSPPRQLSLFGLQNMTSVSKN